MSLSFTVCRSALFALVGAAFLPACSASSDSSSRVNANPSQDAGAGDDAAITPTPVDDSGAANFIIADAPSMGYGDCVAGDYTGVFNGTITIFGLVPLPIQGTVNMTLSSMTAGGGEFKSLTVSNGHVTGSDSNGNAYAADIEGTLNCSSKMFENGMLKNGTYMTLGMVYHFEGPLDATYTNPPATLTGTWGPVKESSGLATAQGMWTASHM